MWLHIENSYVYYCLVSIPEPSCLHTTTYSHPHCLLICHRLLLESQLILCAWQRVLSLLHPRGQEEGVPVWRRLVSHTRLVTVLSARKWSWTDTGQPRLRLQIILITKYATNYRICKICLVFLAQCTPPAQKHRHTGSTACLCQPLYGFWTAAEVCRTRCYPSWAVVHITYQYVLYAKYVQ